MARAPSVTTSVSDFGGVGAESESHWVRPPSIVALTALPAVPRTWVPPPSTPGADCIARKEPDYDRPIATPRLGVRP